MVKIRNRLGWREWISLPALGIKSVKAKVDTGARSSALHVLDEERIWRKRQRWIRFHVESAGAGSPTVECSARINDDRPVTDSGGHTIWRPFIRTELLVGDIGYEIELNLVERNRMRFAMLLGRTALGDFLIDPKRSYLSGKIHAPQKMPKSIKSPLA